MDEIELLTEIFSYIITCAIAAVLGKAIAVLFRTSTPRKPKAAPRKVSTKKSRPSRQKGTIWEDNSNWLEKQREEERRSRAWLFADGRTLREEHAASCDAAAIRNWHRANCAAEKAKGDVQG